jgi:hypothetical protein
LKVQTYCYRERKKGAEFHDEGFDFNNEAYPCKEIIAMMPSKVDTNFDLAKRSLP